MSQDSPPAPRKVTVALGARTDRGKVREANEDSFALDEQAGVAVVADGMGGHAAGEVASRIAAEEVSKALAGAKADIAALEPKGDDSAAQKIGQIVSQANTLILERAAAEPDKKGMGTTVVAAIALEQSAYVAHVGDSRVYWIRGETATLLTRDHSLAAALVDSGRLSAEEAAPLEGVLVRALGISAELAVDVIRIEPQPGDALLLCSDGLWRYFPDVGEIATVIGRAGPKAAEELVQQAVDRGGDDNATAIVVAFKDAAA
jgi:protein phosphatase